MFQFIARCSDAAFVYSIVSDIFQMHFELDRKSEYAHFGGMKFREILDIHRHCRGGPPVKTDQGSKQAWKHKKGTHHNSKKNQGVLSEVGLLQKKDKP